MPADLGRATETARVEEGQDVEGQEAREDVRRVEMLQRHSLVEPVLDEVKLTALALREDHVEESLAL